MEIPKKEHLEILGIALQPDRINYQLNMFLYFPGGDGLLTLKGNRPIEVSYMDLHNSFRSIDHLKEARGSMRDLVTETLPPWLEGANPSKSDVGVILVSSLVPHRYVKRALTIDNMVVVHNPYFVSDPKEIEKYCREHGIEFKEI